MADQRNKEYVQMRGHKPVALAGYFNSAGTATVVGTIRGTGFSVTRSNTGVFTLCLSSTYPGLMGLAVTGPMSNTIPSTSLQVLSSTVSATNTITITVVSNTTAGAVVTEVPTGVGIGFVGIFNNSSLTT